MVMIILCLLHVKITQKYYVKLPIGHISHITPFSRPFNFADGDNLRKILQAKTTLTLMRGKKPHQNFCHKMCVKINVVRIVDENGNIIKVCTYITYYIIEITMAKGR